MRNASRWVGGVVALAIAMMVLPTVAAQAVRVPQTLSHRSAVIPGPVFPGFAIDHLGVVWDDPGHSGHAEEEIGHGAVRFRHEGTWGGWIPLIRDGAPGDGMWASGLVPGGGAEAFQVRGIPAAAQSPRTVALNTSDGPRRTTDVRIGGAAAADRCVSRAEWGANESLRDRESAVFADAQVFTLHHTATGNDDPDPAATVRAIYEYHTVDNGWRDIGYNYLISEDGRVFEGRWSGTLGAGPSTDTYSQACGNGGTAADFAHDSTDAGAWVVQGAHAGGYNTGNVGIALLGSFSSSGRYQGEPKAAAVAAAEGLLAELAGRHGIDPESVVEYANSVNTITVDAISAHRDFNATECPGDNLYAGLPAIRSAVAALLDQTPPVPDAVPTVSITSPVDGSTVDSGAVISFTGSATDPEDGDLTADLTWRSDLEGQIGAGGSFTAVLGEGTHTITAESTDSATNTGRATVTVSVLPAPPGNAITVEVIGYKVRGVQTADLSWAGATSADVDVLRDGARVATTANDGSFTDSVDQRGPGSHTWQVCESGTQNCSDRVVVTF